MSEPLTFIPPIVTHKTRDIIKSDWRTLFTPAESLRFRDAVRNVDGDLSFLPHAEMLDQPSGVPGYETLTWLEVLKISFDEWADATTLNVDDPRVLLSTTALGVVGILDDMARIDVLMQGVPL